MQREIWQRDGGRCRYVDPRTGRRREGKLEGQIRIIKGFLERDFSRSSIEAATGIDEAAFRKFKRQLDATDDGVNT